MKAVITTSLAGAAINRRYVGGRFILSSAYRKAGAQIAKDVRDVYGKKPPIDGPIYVQIDLPCLRICRQEFNDGIPFGDIDAPIKCILDALQTAGVFHDDSQITHLVVRKTFDEQTTIVVERDGDWCS